MSKRDNKNKASDYENIAAEDSSVLTGDESSAENAPTDTLSDESFENNDNSAQLAEAVKEWQDKYLRLSAEFDNYRKRTLKEKMELINTGSEDVIKSILLVLDDMDRAVEAVEKSDDIESARTGLKLIHHKLIDTLRQKGVTEVPAMDLPHDPDMHEAVAQVLSEDKKGIILDVVQKGYRLKDKIIRFPKVVVGE